MILAAAAALALVLGFVLGFRVCIRAFGNALVRFGYCDDCLLRASVIANDLGVAVAARTLRELLSDDKRRCRSCNAECGACRGEAGRANRAATLRRARRAHREARAPEADRLDPGVAPGATVSGVRILAHVACPLAHGDGPCRSCTHGHLDTCPIRRQVEAGQAAGDLSSGPRCFAPASVRTPAPCRCEAEAEARAMAAYERAHRPLPPGAGYRALARARALLARFRRE